MLRQGGWGACGLAGGDDAPESCENDESDESTNHKPAWKWGSRRPKLVVSQKHSFK